MVLHDAPSRLPQSHVSTCQAVSGRSSFFWLRANMRVSPLFLSQLSCTVIRRVATRGRRAAASEASGNVRAVSGSLHAARSNVLVSRGKAAA